MALWIKDSPRSRPQETPPAKGPASVSWVDNLRIRRRITLSTARYAPFAVAGRWVSMLIWPKPPRRLAGPIVRPLDGVRDDFFHRRPEPFGGVFG
jgi:hypothetical protein